MARGIDPNSRYSRLMTDFEKSLLQGYLDECGSVDEAAFQLGISTSTLYRRMKKVGITNKTTDVSETTKPVSKKKKTKNEKVPREIPIDTETEQPPFDEDLNEDLEEEIVSQIEELDHEEDEFEDAEEHEDWNDLFSDIPEDED